MGCLFFHTGLCLKPKIHFGMWKTKYTWGFRGIIPLNGDIFYPFVALIMFIQVFCIFHPFSYSKCVVTGHISKILVTFHGQNRSIVNSIAMHIATLKQKSLSNQVLSVGQRGEVVWLTWMRLKSVFRPHTKFPISWMCSRIGWKYQTFDILWLGWFIVWGWKFCAHHTQCDFLLNLSTLTAQYMQTD